MLFSLKDYRGSSLGSVSGVVDQLLYLVRVHSTSCVVSLHLVRRVGHVVRHVYAVVVGIVVHG